MRNFIALTAAVVTGCANAPSMQRQARATSNAPVAHAKRADTPADPAAHGLAALEAMTFDCPKAALNAAAREAAGAPSQGAYQFSYFRLVNDAHHGAYEVRFKSNHAEEPELRYCVSLYCQQGWDPQTTQIDVRAMGAERHDVCGAHTGANRKRSR
jgi:hypothetical protein